MDFESDLLSKCDFRKVASKNGKREYVIVIVEFLQCSFVLLSLAVAFGTRPPEQGFGTTSFAGQDSSD